MTGWRDIYFQSDDGTPLEGWFIPAKGGKSGKLIIFNHALPMCRGVFRGILKFRRVSRKRALLVWAAGITAVLITIKAVPLHAAAAENASALNACSLLSTEELGRLLGSPIRRPRPGTAEKGTACRFAVGGTDTLNISLWPTTPKDFDEFKKMLADNGASLENVSEVGDAGYYWDNRIYARTGDNGVTVWLGSPIQGVDQKQRHMVLSVAKAAVNRLR